MDYKILNTIASPKDVKRLSHGQLAQLADEIRTRLVETISETGGHLASNLGAVELTLALHRVMESPTDKIIWDVGHQCYVHKLITGRNETFTTLRQYGGLSGFPKKSESAHDIFDSGHASNSISVALGIAEARDKAGGDEHVIIVIGDGSLTGGIAYEALNQAGHLGTKLIVILNDNEMSISSNVGAMSSYLSQLRLDPVHTKLRKEVEKRIKKIPAIGELVYDIGMHIKESVKALLVPGMLFEELGFTYIGPMDGHDVKEIEKNLMLAKQVEGPVLVHVVTKKGLGYTPAVECPEKWHGTAPFVKRTGEPKSFNNVPTYTEVFGEALVKLAGRNEKIIAITAAMTSGTGLNKFQEVYPDRFYDVGIAEPHAVTFAAGLAIQGYLPVVAIYSTFLQRSLDQIMQDVSLQELPVVFAIDRAGIVGEDGPTHHGAFDLSYLRSIPGLMIMAPKDENELQHMLYTATEIGGPVALRYPRDRGLGIELSESYRMLQIGKGEILLEGSDVCLLAIGRMVKSALDAAKILGERGISASVANMRFIKPLDEEIVAWATGNHRLVVTVEENSLVGGFGSAVLETISELGVTAPVQRLGLPDRFISHGSMKRLLAEVGLDANGIAYSINRKLDEISSGKKRAKAVGRRTV
ncbi:MAG TPA: 1-deoxy-D-xylulose-5-phosphate synthase [Anaerolineae bacterium]|jgi:1-deoxy-D-xylulose-5-phosphate synthase|nr:1-deoxy-D-xylulose-5-phosphate synthase [Anaerolineae bacterium]